MPAHTHNKLSLTRLRHGVLGGLLLVLTILPACYLTLPVQADGLDDRSLQLLDDAPSATTTYTFSFMISNSSTVGSFSILFCSNTPLLDDSCTVPVGLDVTNAVLSSQTGLTDFTASAPATNELILSRIPSLITPPVPVTLTFDNVVNPSSIGYNGSYYARLAAYSSIDATGTPVDYGGVAFAIANNLQINSIVPPYLTFCSGLVISTFDCSTASGDYINFGNLSTAHSSQAASQLLVATNAPNGYVIQVYGTTMTSGNNVIPAITSDSISRPGTSQFGINLRANAVPAIGADPTGPGSGEPTVNYNNPDHYKLVSNDTIASSLNADDYRKYTASYIVNTSSAQPPGVYASTLTYVCAGSF
jgi:hypothetical protein